MSFLGLLNQRVTIKRTARTADGYAGYTTAESVLERRVACRINAMSSEEMAIIYDKQTVMANFYVFISSRNWLKEGDLLILEDGSSREFAVKLKQNYDELGMYLKLACKENDRTPA